MAIWARLLADSTDIYQWLKDSSKSVSRIRSGTIDTTTNQLCPRSEIQPWLLTIRRLEAHFIIHFQWPWTCVFLVLILLASRRHKGDPIYRVGFPRPQPPNWLAVVPRRCQRLCTHPFPQMVVFSPVTWLVSLVSRGVNSGCPGDLDVLIRSCPVLTPVLP